MNNEHFLFVVSGPSGSGKDTIVCNLQKEHPEIERSISATSRGMRLGEKEGVNYYYLTPERFKELIENDEILEYTQFCGNFYGTLKREVDKRLANKTITILVIEVEGARNIKRIYPDCTTVFVRPPSYEELSRRLHLRNTEDEATIEKRLARALEEIEYAVDYDHIIINDDIDTCTQDLYDIIIEQTADE
ncbi:MAG: guanylate kinase [Oscillospiraceae bacterium]